MRSNLHNSVNLNWNNNQLYNDYGFNNNIGNEKNLYEFYNNSHQQYYTNNTCVANTSNKNNYYYSNQNNNINYNNKITQKKRSKSYDRYGKTNKNYGNNNASIGNINYQNYGTYQNNSNFSYNNPNIYSNYQPNSYLGNSLGSSLLAYYNPQNNNYMYNYNYPNFSSPSHSDKKGHLGGLVNIGQTCYMNASLQCFCNIENLRVYFKRRIDLKDDGKKLSPVFGELISNLWNPSTKKYSPKKFKERLGLLNNLFYGISANDAKDFVSFFIERLHKELNLNSKRKNYYYKNNDIFNMRDSCNKEIMRGKFSKIFSEENRSIMTDLFYGMFYSDSLCLKCQVHIYNYQAFYYINFPLEQVRQFKIKCNNNMYNFETVTIEECFIHYQFPEQVEGYCNHCQSMTNLQITQNFSALPNIIIITLNRGKGLQYPVKISFNRDLNLGNFVEVFQNESKYELIGVVSHYGTSSSEGHFVARCKSPIDQNWYYYNDEDVSTVNDFQTEVLCTGDPYILFYKKKGF